MQTSKIKQSSESCRPPPLTLTYICNSTDTSYLKKVSLSSVSVFEKFKYLTGWEEWRSTQKLVKELQTMQSTDIFLASTLF